MWVPDSAQERHFYDTLFQLADAMNTGRLAGQAAVDFLLKSGLSLPILKKIWDISADPNLNYLRRGDFYVAMRLIATAQSYPGRAISGERLKAESAVRLSLPRLQGIPVPSSVTFSRGMATRSGDPTGVHEGFAPVDPYAMSVEEKSKYQMLFPRYDADQDGYITGHEAHALFSKSGLPRDHLRQIWDLSDADNDNKLSMAEFCVGMHLIICASKKGLAIPTSVPRTLVNTSFASPPNGSSGTPVFQPPARPSPSAKPFSTPYAGPTLPPLGIAATDLGDAFSQLSADLPIKAPASSISSEAEGDASTSATTVEPLPSAPAVTQTSIPLESQDKAFWHSSTDTQAAGKPSSRGGSSDGSWVAAVCSQSELQRDSAAQNQSSIVNHVGALVQKLQLEKSSVRSTVEASKVNNMDHERQLHDMGVEIESLQVELDDLRTQFQEQQEETLKLRERVTQAAVERATLLAEIKACKAALDAQEGETALLRQEDELIDSTRSALQSYKATLIQGTALVEMRPPQHVITGAQSARHLPSPPQPAELETKSEAPPEPTMPAKTPPPPPESMASPRLVEDPFAAIIGTEGVANDDDLPRRETTTNLSTRLVHQSSDEEKGGTFDAFPSVEPFESDPFAMNGFSVKGAEEGTIDDPFATDAAFSNVTAAASDRADGGAEEGTIDDPFATDAAFSNVTAAASDRADAFPSSSRADFDAFGQ